MTKNLPANGGDTRDRGSSLGGEELLEEEMTMDSSFLAWEIPQTEEPVHGATKNRTRLSD